MKPTKPKTHLGISSRLSILVGIFVLGFGVVGGYIALSNLHQEKKIDVLAILHLETEREARAVEKKLQAHQFADAALPVSRDALNAHPPDAVVSVGPKRTDPYAVETGWLGKRPKLESLDFMRITGRQQRFSLWSHGGLTYLARFVTAEDAPLAGLMLLPQRSAILLWKIDTKDWFASAGRAADGVLAYVANREGQLVFSSDRRVTPATFTARNLVQEFAKSPLTHGQLEIETDEAGSAFGMYSQVGDSNLVLFKEAPTAIVMSPVRTVAISFVGTLTFVLLFGLLALQLQMSRLVNPLMQLGALAREIGRGNLDVLPVVSNFGEVRGLSHDFRTMVDGLVRRDRAITSFVEGQKQVVRLEGERKVARGIQDALLPKASTLDGAGIDLAVHYQSSPECAGDWYSYDCSPSTGEVVVAVADVSGHGASSAMFTAIIAGLFARARLDDRTPFDALAFFRELNKVMMKMGGRNWHATFTVIRYYRGSDEIEISNAGGTPVFMIKQRAGEGGIAKAEVLPSDLIGLADTEMFAQRTVPFPRGTCLFLHTDGLTEAVDKDHKMYSRKRLRRLLETIPEAAPSVVLSGILADWNAHRGDVSLDDDVCLIALKRSSR